MQITNTSMQSTTAEPIDDRLDQRLQQVQQYTRGQLPETEVEEFESRLYAIGFDPEALIELCQIENEVAEFTDNTLDECEGLESSTEVPSVPAHRTTVVIGLGSSGSRLIEHRGSSAINGRRFVVLEGQPADRASNHPVEMIETRDARFTDFMTLEQSLEIVAGRLVCIQAIRPAHTLHRLLVGLSEPSVQQVYARCRDSIQRINTDVFTPECPDKSAVDLSWRTDIFRTGECIDRSPIRPILSGKGVEVVYEKAHSSLLSASSGAENCSACLNMRYIISNVWPHKEKDTPHNIELIEYVSFLYFLQFVHELMFEASAQRFPRSDSDRQPWVIEPGRRKSTLLFRICEKEQLMSMKGRVIGEMEPRRHRSDYSFPLSAERGAALCHDLGHSPMGHALQSWLPSRSRQESVCAFMSWLTAASERSFTNEIFVEYCMASRIFSGIQTMSPHGTEMSNPKILSRQAPLRNAAAQGWFSGLAFFPESPRYDSGANGPSAGVGPAVGESNCWP